MSQAAAKVQEPSMEEILASIRRIIADDDTSKTPAKPAPPIVAAVPPPEAAPPPTRPAAVQPPPAPPPPPPAPPSPDQSEVDAMMAKLDAPPGGLAPEKDSQDILELTESMAAPDDDAPIFQTIDGQSDVVFADTPGEKFASPPRSGADRPLLAPSTSAAVDSAFNALAHTVLVNNARTLEDLVREMLRPMLKSWLDDNLPTMVERIVKAEIDRVARGRG